MSEQGVYKLRLYMAGISPDNQQMILQMKEYINEKHGIEYQVEVVDVLEEPEIAIDNNILLTPTLVRELSSPLKKYVLDFKHKHKFFMDMDVIMNEDG